MYILAHTHGSGVAIPLPVLVMFPIPFIIASAMLIQKKRYLLALFAIIGIFVAAFVAFALFISSII